MFKEIINKVQSAKSVGIFVHINPDGDALGSAFSLKNVLEGLDKTAHVFISGEVEPCLKDIFDTDKKKTDKNDVNISDLDLLVAVDCADVYRLGEYEDDFSSHLNTAAIDHHITHKNFANETAVKDISSCCQLIYMMYKEMGQEISLQTAEYLYVGIITDTGSFKFSSSDSDTHRVAAELIDMGVDFAGLSKKIFDTRSREYLNLYAYAIESMKFYCDNKIAVLKLSEDDFKRFGTTEAEAAAIVSVPGNIRGVMLGVYIRDRGDECKVSLRSFGSIDVSAIAENFGGGGHRCAAGYSVSNNGADENLKALINCASSLI